ncbi:MAG: hypothetical protein SVW02_03795 [Candidatus Nanohaloarchaea archaeon]|nr:hypothetical protein [Candidatus Nanohaloarchaea archaeon]
MTGSRRSASYQVRTVRIEHSDGRDTVLAEFQPDRNLIHYEVDGEYRDPVDGPISARAEALYLQFESVLEDASPVGVGAPNGEMETVRVDLYDENGERNQHGLWPVEDVPRPIAGLIQDLEGDDGMLTDLLEPANQPA